MLSNAQAEKNVVVLNFTPEFFIFISVACEYGTGAGTGPSPTESLAGTIGHSSEFQNF